MIDFANMAPAIKSNYRIKPVSWLDDLKWSVFVLQWPLMSWAAIVGRE